MGKVKIVAAIAAGVVFGAGTIAAITIKKKLNLKKMSKVDEEEMEFLLSRTKKFLDENHINDTDNFYDTIVEVYNTFTNDYRKFFVTAYDYIERNDVNGFSEYFEYIRHIMSAYTEARDRVSEDICEDEIVDVTVDTVIDESVELTEATVEETVTNNQ